MGGGGGVNNDFKPSSVHCETLAIPIIPLCVVLEDGGAAIAHLTPLVVHPGTTRFRKTSLSTIPPLCVT
jgi:hypothetical protein